MMPVAAQVDPDRGEEAVADYLSSMSASLGKIARQNGFDALAYLFELAKLEADSIAAVSVNRRATGERRS